MTLHAFNATSFNAAGAFSFLRDTVLPQTNEGLPLRLAPCFHLPFGIMYLHTYRTSLFNTPTLQSKAVGINCCTAKMSDFLKNLLATSRKLVSHAAFSKLFEKFFKSLVAQVFFADEDCRNMWDIMPLEQGVLVDFVSANLY